MSGTRAPTFRLFAVQRLLCTSVLVFLVHLPLEAAEDSGERVVSPLHSLHEAEDDAANEERGKTSPPSRMGILGVQAKIAPNPVDFGASFDLVVEVKHVPELQIDLPQKVPEKAALPQVGQIRRETLPVASSVASGSANVPETTTEGTSVLTRFHIPFLALDLKELKTPAIVLRPSAGEAIEIPELPVPVRSDDNANAGTPTDDTAGAGTTTPDPGSPLELQQAPGPLLFAVFDDRPIVVLLVALFAALVYWIYRRWPARRSKATHPTPEVIVRRPPHEVALERLDALLAEGLLARNEISLFVTRLMDEVLRDFLEARFDVAAGRRTTRELMVSLLETSAAGLDVSGTRAVLEQADLVKFARAQLAGDAAYEMAERVRALIVATKAAATTSIPRAEPIGGSETGTSFTADGASPTNGRAVQREEEP